MSNPGLLVEGPANCGFVRPVAMHALASQTKKEFHSVSCEKPAAEFPRDSMKEIQQLSRFLPGLSLIPRSAAQNSVVQEDSSCAGGTTQRR
jgi:hypothetical protein